MNNVIHKDELLDLVDEQDRVIGQLVRSKVYKQGLNNFRVINAFLINEQGQLWVPRRAPHKPLCPLQLDVGVGGHVGSGETYEQALARELLEEVDLDLATVSYQELGAMTPHEHGVTAFLRVYKIFITQAPILKPSDFIEYFWLTPCEYLALIESNKDKAKSDVPLMLRHFIDQLTLQKLS